MRFEQNWVHQKSARYRCNRAHQAGQHKAVIEQIFADAGGAGAVKIDCGDYGGVVGDKEVAIYTREHRN